MLLSSLRQQILDRAIRGQLVEQRPEEGTAEDLYQQIQAEKKRLIDNGTIKKEKPLQPISDEEIPFNIPPTWKWVRLGELSKGVQYGTSNKSSNAGAAIVLRMGNIQNGEIDYANIVFSNDEADIEKFSLRKGDVLFNRTNSPELVGKSAIFRGSTTPVLFAGYLIRINQMPLLDSDYINYYFNSPLAKAISLKVQAFAVSQSNISGSKLVKYIIPLPPLKEQRRISHKVASLFAALDSIELSRSRISKIQTELTKRILDKAIQGKLVPQRPEEGTAEDLYQQIQAEKQRLIASGTIKKEKPLPPIEEKDIPFDIPETWKWVRLGACGTFTRGSGIKKTEVVDEGLPCVRYGQLYTTYKTRFSEAVSYIPAELFAKCKQANHGDILMALTGENKVDIAMAVLYEGTPTLAISGDMTKFTPLLIDPLYLVYTLNSPYGINCKTERSTGDIIVHTSNDKLSTIPIPLPPYAEQKRIVSKIEELLTNCGNLGKSL